MRVIDRDDFARFGKRLDMLTGQPAASSPVASSKEDEVLALARQIDKGGVASVPGLAPDKDNPRTILHFESLQATNVEFKTKVFTLDSDWEIAWKAGPASAAPAESFFAVALYSSEDRDGKEPHTLVSEMFSTLPIFVGRTKSDLIIFPSGGSFYLGIKSTVPYAVDVRKGLRR
jgi:hypothetical protein